MYWSLGSINVGLKSPRKFEEADGISFHEWMEKKGWKFNDYPLDPLSKDYSVRNAEVENTLFQWEKDVSEWDLFVNIPKHLLKMYSTLGVVSNQQAIPLCDNCANSKICWQGIENRKPLQQHWSHVSLPWIGQKYNAIRMVALGINPYEAGGIDFYPHLIPEAKKELNNGKIKVNFDHDGYSGTLLWHRIGLYSSQIILKFVNDENPMYFPELSPADAFDWISFTNHIKCSPVGERSEPSQAMWENCHFILKQELQILDPKLLLVLGSSNNLSYILKNVIEQDPVLLDQTEYVRLYLARMNGKQIGIINVPHPSARAKGASHQISKDLDTLLNLHSKRLQDQLRLPSLHI